MNRKKSDIFDCISNLFSDTDISKNTKSIYLRLINRIVKDFEISSIDQLFNIQVKDINAKYPGIDNTNKISALRKILNILNENGYQNQIGINIKKQKSPQKKPYKYITYETKPKFDSDEIFVIWNKLKNINNHFDNVSDIRINSLRKIDFLSSLWILRSELILDLIYCFGLETEEIIEIAWDSLIINNDKRILVLKFSKWNLEKHFEMSDYLHDKIKKMRYFSNKINPTPNELLFSLGARDFGKKLTSKGVRGVFDKISLEIGKKITPKDIRSLSRDHLSKGLRLSKNLQVQKGVRIFHCPICNQSTEWNEDTHCPNCNSSYVNSDGANLLAKNGVVYFIKTKDHPYVKIGITQTHLSRRFSSLQSSNMFELEVFGVIFDSDPASIEAKIHEYFSPNKMRGEWFKLDEFQLNEGMNKLGLLKRIQKFENWISIENSHSYIK